MDCHPTINGVHGTGVILPCGGVRVDVVVKHVFAHLEKLLDNEVRHN